MGIDFKNNGISNDDWDVVLKESMKIIREWRLNRDGRDIKVTVSKKFGSNTNGNITINKLSGDVRIALSYKVYEHFGIDVIIGTLKHEFAHLISYLMTGFLDHGENFKEVCLEIGGHMNKKMASGKFSSCANDKFLGYENRRYKLECPCGHCVIYRDRLNKNFLKKHCVKCKTYVKNWKIEDRG